MAVNLRAMEPAEFHAYAEHLSRDYAASRVASGEWPERGAEARAAEHLRNLLPQGPATPGHHLSRILDPSDGTHVGYLWYQVQSYRGGIELFVLDIEIFAPYRRRGLARGAIDELVEAARREGAGRLRLHVFADNLGARKLYGSYGFEETDVWVAKAVSPEGQGTARSDDARWRNRPALRLVPLEAREFDAFRIRYLDEAAVGAVQDGSGWGATSADERAAKMRAHAERALGNVLPLGVRTKGHHLVHVHHATSGTLVGSLWYSLPDEERVGADAEVRFLRIQPAARGRGYAMATLHKLQGLARQAGATRLTAAITARNQAGRSLFKRAEFSETDLWLAFEVPPGS